MRIKLRRDQILRLLDGFPIQVPTEVGLLEFEGEQPAEWKPLRRLDVPQHIIEQHRITGNQPPQQIWANDIYEVFLYDAGIDQPEQEGIVWLSVKRYDRAPVRNWRHFQQIKNEVCGEDREAVELFPSESRLADSSNQYHLWVFPPDFRLPFGFPAGMVVIRDEEVQQWNQSGGRGRQEPMQPGLTVGKKLDEARSPEVEEVITGLVSSMNRPGVQPGT